MASAPVALELGPRNRRRLAVGALTLLATVTVATGGRWFFAGLPFASSPNHTTPSPVPSRSAITLIPMQAGLSYGITKQQMMRRLGQPEKIAGQCLQYPENIKDFAGETINAVRMCFWNGQYQHWYIERDGRWGTFAQPKVVIPPPTAP